MSCTRLWNGRDMSTVRPPRRQSFGETGSPSAVDRFGVWLSERQVRRWVPQFTGLRIADLGCGYEAKIVRSLIDELESAVVVDVSLAADLMIHPKIRAIEGCLPGAVAVLDDSSVDVVFALSVLEHVWESQDLLAACHRILAPGGKLLVNVPSWLGKRALEFSAFKLGLSPAEEMDDHKAYYDIKDLWPMLIRAGFVPHNVRCMTHKFGLNTFAVCVR